MGCKCKDKVVKEVKKIVKEVNTSLSDIMDKIYGSKK